MPAKLVPYVVMMPEGWKPRAHNNCDFCKKDLACHKHFGICPLSRAVPAKEVEPLAVTANKRGFSMRIGSNEKGMFFISLRRGRNTRQQISGTTYAAAESAARAYLEGLPDVEKEGR